MPVQAGIADLSPAVHHGVGRAQQNIIVRRVYHRYMVLLQIRSIQNRQRELTMHIIHMDDVGLKLLQQCLELTLRLERVNQRGGFLHLLECGDLPHIILFRDKILAPTTWFVIGMLHGEERHLMAKRLQAFGQGKEICFGAALAVEVLVDQQNAHHSPTFSPLYKARV